MKPILIAGPTASGKSGLALAIAREFDGVVVMQMPRKFIMNCKSYRLALSRRDGASAS